MANFQFATLFQHFLSSWYLYSLYKIVVHQKSCFKINDLVGLRKTNGLETWRSEDHTYTSYSQTDTTVSRTEQSLSQETLDQVQMENIMTIQSIT